MALPPLARGLAARAEREGLGAYRGPLTPPRATALRAVSVGVAAASAAVTLLARLSAPPWWAVVGLGLVAGAGAIGVLMGLVELSPGPGRVHLFDGGLLHEHPDGSVEAVTTGTTGRTTRQANPCSSSEVEAGLVVLDPRRRDRVQVAFAQQHVVTRVQLDL